MSDPATSARLALAEFARALPALGAALTITLPGGATVLDVGEDEGTSSVRPFGRASRLTVASQGAGGHEAAITVRRVSGEVFTRREEQVIGRVAAMFATWLSRVAAEPSHASDRRADPREFAQVLDRHAIQALHAGTDVSVVVISVPALVGRPDALQQCVAGLRAGLRGSDLAGGLSSHEIGVLLHGVSDEQVRPVIDRMLSRPGSGCRDGFEESTIGSASYRVGQPDTGSLVRVARANAARDQSTSESKGGSR